MKHHIILTAVLFVAGVLIATAQPAIDGFRLGMKEAAMWDHIAASRWHHVGVGKVDRQAVTYTLELAPGDTLGAGVSLDVAILNGAVSFLELRGNLYTVEGYTGTRNIDRLPGDVASLTGVIIQQVGKPDVQGLNLATVSRDSLLRVDYRTDNTVATWLRSKRRRYRVDVRLAASHAGRITPVVTIGYI